MIKRLILLLITFYSFSVCAKPTVELQEIISKIKQLNGFNQFLSVLENDKKIDMILTQQNQLLTDLILQLRITSVKKLPLVVNKNQLNFLETRYNVNKKKNHALAMQRDQFKLALYQEQQNTYDFITYLIQATNNYKNSQTIITYTKQALVDAIRQRELMNLPKSQPSSIYEELEENYKAFHIANSTYQDILRYIVHNPEKISATHWLKNFTLTSMIAYINDFEFISPVNHKLSAFKIDAGGIFLSIIIVAMVYLCHPFVFKCTSWIVETYILKPEADHQELIYHEIRKPLRASLIFFGLHLATYALFYKTDYRSVIENIIFVIYAFIYVWFLFKLLDSIALLHIRKINLTNKELKKELFNLALWVIKGTMLVVVTVLCLKHLGINIIAILSTLGISGLAFALAAKDTLSNLFGGLTILFDNIFRMGDSVKIGEVRGTVAEIGLRSTTIRTFDNALITIPNSLVSVSSVTNWNRRIIGRRIKMYVAITYDSDINDIRHALKDIREMLQNHADIANTQSTVQGKKRHNFKFSSQEDTLGIKDTQVVFMDQYNDFSIDLLIYCFSKTVEWEKWLGIKEDILFKTAEILQKNNLEFAYPTEIRINRNEPIRETAT